MNKEEKEKKRLEPKSYSIGLHLGRKLPYFKDSCLDESISLDVGRKAIDIVIENIPDSVRNDESCKSFVLCYGGGSSSKHFPLVKGTYEYLDKKEICLHQINRLDLSTDGFDLSDEMMEWLEFLEKEKPSSVALSIRTGHEDLKSRLEYFGGYKDIVVNKFGVTCIGYYVDSTSKIEIILKDLELIKDFGFRNAFLLSKGSYCTQLLLDDSEDEKLWFDIFRNTLRWYLSVRKTDSLFRICLYERFYRVVSGVDLKRNMSSWLSQCGVYISDFGIHIYVLPDGSIYSCGGVPKVNMDIGSVYSGFDWEKIQKLRKHIESHCSGCSISKYCFKGCFVVEDIRDLRSDVISKAASDRFSCKIQRLIVDEIKQNLKNSY